MSDAPSPLITFELVTIFPEMFDSFLGASLLGKALARGLVAVHRTNPRDFVKGRRKTVDDAPYGGGPGMVMRPNIWGDALDEVCPDIVEVATPWIAPWMVRSGRTSQR
jgi:tRNA (guanine37-N1)-methyltransferase